MAEVWLLVTGSGIHAAWVDDSGGEDIPERAGRRARLLEGVLVRLPAAADYRPEHAPDGG